VTRKNNRSYKSSIVIYNLTKQTFNYVMSSSMNIIVDEQLLFLYMFKICMIKQKQRRKNVKW
jgi:hypothetical protein